MTEAFGSVALWLIFLNFSLPPMFLFLSNKTKAEKIYKWLFFSLDALFVVLTALGLATNHLTYIFNATFHDIGSIFALLIYDILIYPYHLCIYKNLKKKA